MANDVQYDMGFMRRHYWEGGWGFWEAITYGFSKKILGVLEKENKITSETSAGLWENFSWDDEKRV